VIFSSPLYILVRMQRIPGFLSLDLGSEKRSSQSGTKAPYLILARMLVKSCQSGGRHSRNVKIKLGAGTESLMVPT
jgi:hypothetical protein